MFRSNRTRRPWRRRTELKRLVVTGLLVLSGLAFAAPGRLVLAPAAGGGDRAVVTAGQLVSLQVSGPELGSSAAALVTDANAGREVWQLPLQRAGGLWTAKVTLATPGPHVLTARLYDAGRVYAAAVDVQAVNEAVPNTSAALDLDFMSSSGRKGWDVNGWWGVLAMLVMFIIIWVGTQWRGRSARAAR